MKGNLVELAVAFIIATAFAAVVEALVKVILDLIGKAGGLPSFSSYKPAGIHVGLFITALIAFLIIAAVVYFLVVLPYNTAKARFEKASEEEVVTSDEVLVLREIRDLLESRGGTAGTISDQPSV